MGNTKQRLDLYTKYIFLLGLVGVFFIFGVFSKDTSIELNYILIVGAAFFTALENNITLKIKDKIIDSFSFVYLSYSVIILLILIIYSLYFKVNLLPSDFEQFISLCLFSAVFLIALFLWIKSYSVGDKIILSYLGFSIPVVSNTLLILLYDYKITTSMIIGFIIILISGILLNSNIKNKIILKYKYSNIYY